jgi:hypothetical protein
MPSIKIGVAGYNLIISLGRGEPEEDVSVNLKDEVAPDEIFHHLNHVIIE